MWQRIKKKVYFKLFTCMESSWHWPEVVQLPCYTSLIAPSSLASASCRLAACSYFHQVISSSQKSEEHLHNRIQDFKLFCIISHNSRTRNRIYIRCLQIITVLKNRISNLKKLKYILYYQIKVQKCWVQTNRLGLTSIRHDLQAQRDHIHRLGQQPEQSPSALWGLKKCSTTPTSD